MDGSRFDELSRLMAGAVSRRVGLMAALGGLLALPAGRRAALAQEPEQDPEEESAFPVLIAKKRKKRKTCRPACVDGYACAKGVCACASGILCGGVCCVAGSACDAGICSLGPEPGCWRPESTFGSGPGPGAGELFYPYGISVAADGLTAYVSDSGNNRIAIWTRPSVDGAAWEQAGAFGAKGTAVGQFRHPLGSALTADGLTLLVADLDNGRVTVWTRPDAGGQVWAAQAAFGSKGRRPDQFKQPITVAVSPDGLTAWVADAINRKVAEWTRPDAASAAWTLRGLIGDAASATPFEVPVGVWAAPDARTLLVTDGVANHVTMWTRADAPGGEWTRTGVFGSAGWTDGAFRTPWSVVATPDGLAAWVCDAENNRVSTWARPDAASAAWTWRANFGSGPGTDAGQFYAPIGIALLDGGRGALVADTGNSRISAWRDACPA